MKYLTKIVAWLVLAVCLCALLGACRKLPVAVSREDGQTDIDYADIDLSECLGAVTYKELTVTLDSAESSKEEALWAAILENAEIKSYPEDKVSYYFEQEKSSYMYLVGNDEEDYRALLTLRGISEEDMMADAKEMVAKDIILKYIIETEQIALTEEEKTEHYDRYVDKYVNDYGYVRSYVTVNMSDMVYESMLYDKTMEYLFGQNTFVMPE